MVVFLVIVYVMNPFGLIYTTNRSPTISIEANVTEGFYMSPMAGGSMIEYSVSMALRNEVNYPIEIEYIHVIFDAGGEGLSNYIVREEVWILEPGDKEFHNARTNGYTYDILMIAKENDLEGLILHVDIYLKDESYEDIQYIAILPPIDDLPIEYIEPGYPLTFLWFDEKG